MNDNEIDLDAYLRRIGYDGPRTPTLETLRALHELHPAAIAFEAIDVLLERGIDITPAAVDAKLIAAGRGGYCFEQNSLFKRALAALGFEVEGLAARVRWMQPPDAPPPTLSHMALRVTVDGRPWLVDVGFGGCVLTEPLLFDTTEPQATRHETFRLVPDDRHIRLLGLLDGEWTPIYDLSPEPRLDVDYEPSNWFTATHPKSLFRHNLMVARTTPDARYALLNNRLTVRRPDGNTDRRFLDADGIESALAETFRLPVEPDWRGVIERAAAVETAAA